jgi:hypothetical protein
MNSRIRSQKFGIGDIFIEGWRVYWKQFLNILIIILIIYVPLEVIAFITSSSALSRTPEDPGQRLFLDFF